MSTEYYPFLFRFYSFYPLFIHIKVSDTVDKISWYIITPIVLVYATLRSGQTEVYQTSCPPRQARTHKSRKIYHGFYRYSGWH